MVAVDAEGYASQEVEAKPVYGKKEWCDVFMTAQAAETSTTGKVFVSNSDSDWEERIEGAEVVITDGEKVLCEGLTNSNGRFDFEIKPALESSSGIEDGRAVRVVEDGIAVANGTTVRVFDLTGATVAATDGAAQTIRLDAGIYIIVTENSCEKIIIR